VQLTVLPGAGLHFIARDAAAVAADWIGARFAGRPSPTAAAEPRLEHGGAIRAAFCRSAAL
jgi:hypothetical protein